MTVDELRTELNNKFGLSPWPKTYKVDYETYINVCNYVFYERSKLSSEHINIISIIIGGNNKIKFKNVELIPELVSFNLTDQETKALYDYFINRAGYVSYEFDPLIIILIRRLRDYLEGPKE